MNEKTVGNRHLENGFIKPPAYPFSARDLFGDLRRRLVEEHGMNMNLDRLGHMIGHSISTTHHWFHVYSHPHVLAFMCLLERLSASERQTFITDHCRTFPTLNDARLVASPSQLSALLRLLKQDAGLTLVTGGTDLSRTLLLTAMGHSFPSLDHKQRAAAGIDLHRPSDFVPVGTVTYIDGLKGSNHNKQLVDQSWPRILTSKAPVLLLNRVWSSFPELRDDIVRLTQRKHVVLADQEMPDAAYLKKVRMPVHTLVLLSSKRIPGAIRVNLKCRKC